MQKKKMKPRKLSASERDDNHRAVEMLPEIVGAQVVWNGILNENGDIGHIARQCVPALMQKAYDLAMAEDNLAAVTLTLKEFTDRGYGKSKDTIRIESGSNEEAVTAIRALVQEGMFTKKQGVAQLRGLGIIDVDFEEIDDED